MGSLLVRATFGAGVGILVLGSGKRSSENGFQTTLDSDFKCNTSVLVVGTDSRIKHLAFRSQVFFLVGGSTH
ncbi:hypothetical protein, partial [Neisseria meningitidis]|uniref:hypothetical protein n=1 Tax=Neisseria meningitidis TaxID=487 RepID=UPI003133CDAC